MKTAIVFAISSLLSLSSFASEIRSATIKSMSDISIVTLPSACEKTEQSTKKKLFGIIKKAVSTTKKIDCFGVVLKNVAGISKLGSEVQIGDVILMPLETLVEAEQIETYLIRKIQDKVPQGQSITLSAVKYQDRPFALSLFTNQAEDTREVFVGGITLGVKNEKTEGNVTFSSSRTYNLGI